LHVCAATAELAARIPEHIKQVIQVLLINAEREARAEADGRGLGPVVIDSSVKLEPKRMVAVSVPS
jgi:hypothetical protein